MKHDPILHARRSIRLPDYDYAQAGAYYITICSHQRRCLFGAVKDDRIRLSRIGEIVREQWLQTPRVRPGVTLDDWVIMPNHMHAIVFVGAHGNAPPPLGLHWPDAAAATTRPLPRDGNVGAHGYAPSAPNLRWPDMPDRTTRLPAQEANGRAHVHAPLQRPRRCLGSLVGGFKGTVTARVNALRNTPGAPVWQRGYHEHIIRDEPELHDIRLYIAQNPSQWATDAENPRYRTVMGRRAARPGHS
jgi:REP element-mobilizing transposase RayT